MGITEWLVIGGIVAVLILILCRAVAIWGSMSDSFFVLYDSEDDDFIMEEAVEYVLEFWSDNFPNGECDLDWAERWAQQDPTFLAMTRALGMQAIVDAVNKDQAK